MENLRAAVANVPQRVSGDYFVGGNPTTAYASFSGWVGANSTLVINTSGYCTSVYGYWDYSGSYLQFNLLINGQGVNSSNAGNRRFSYGLNKGDTLHFSSDRSMYFELTLYHANTYYIV